MGIEPKYNNLQTPLSNPTGLCPNMSSSTTHVYNLGQLGVNSYTHSSTTTELRDITIVHGKCTYLYNESPHNEIWPLTVHFNMNKSSLKCKPSYLIQPMSSILCGLLVNTLLQSCQSDTAATMSQYGHFPVTIS